MAGFEVSARRVVQLLAEVRDEHGVELSEIDLGGGLGIAYTSDDDPREPHEIAKALGEIVTRECESAGLATPRISVEPGRAIVGPTAFTLYEVGTVKPLEGLRTYVSVDGGMSDNIRTALYDAEYTVTLASRTSDAEPMLVRVVGKHCEWRHRGAGRVPPRGPGPGRPARRRRPPGPTAVRWPATTTTRCVRRWWPWTRVRRGLSCAGRRRRISCVSMSGDEILVSSSGLSAESPEGWARLDQLMDFRELRL